MLYKTHSTRIKECLRNEYREKDKEVMGHIRVDKKEFIYNIAEQAEEAAYHQNTLYTLIKKLSNDGKFSNITTIEDKDGNLISRRAETAERWNKLFKEILNRKDPERHVKDEETESIEVEEISTEEPIIEEIKRAIKQLKNGKSARIDSITAEILKVDIDFLTRKVKFLVDKIWKKEQIPKKWKRNNHTNYQRKGKFSYQEENLIRFHSWRIYSCYVDEYCSLCLV